jgi:subtilisin family serine protease
MVSSILSCARSSRGWSVSLAFLLLALLSAQAQEAFRLNDAGKARDLVVAADEIHVVSPGTAAEDLKTQVEAAFSGATVLGMAKGQALVQVPSRPTIRAGASKAAAFSGTVAGAEVEAVLYPPAGVHNRLTRRVATPEVLVEVPAGETAESLAAGSGAKSSRPTALANRVMLRFGSGFAALDAAKSLQGRGVTADVQLRRQHVPRFLPNDVFFPNQWHLRNTGQGTGVRGMDANVLDAWDITKGSGVTIAVVDDSVQTTHPDLQPNCPPLNSGFHHDFNGGDNNPAPVNDYYHQDEHGTSVSGVAAGKGNNSIGISGAAPDAQLVGIRLISEGTTDSEDASALYWHPAGLTVGACNNSWGPTSYYAGAGPLAKLALQNATTLGRGGKGQITLFAAGNSQEDYYGARDANADSFCNSRFVIAVGAVNNRGVQTAYSQRGANVLVSAPSSDDGYLGIWTTDDVGGVGYNPGTGEPSSTIDPQQSYTNSFGGTSSATPLVTGCVALMLGANPNLGWRDVHEIVAATAVKVTPNDPGWVFNGGGFKFSHRYGGGMINATAAVVRALDWDNLGPEQMQSQTATSLPVAIPENSTGVSRTFDFSGSPNLRVERGEIVLKMTHAHRSDVEITLTSPAGTKTILSELRARQSASDGYDDDINIQEGTAGWTFSTTQSWGENSTGVWTLITKDRRSGVTGTLDSVTVRLYGTTAPLERVGFQSPLYTIAETGGAQTVRVNRVGAADGPFTVDVITSTHGTATAGVDADFDAVTTTLDFATGETFKDVVVPIHADTVDESPESIYLLLKNPVGAALGGVTLAAIKVTDDDEPTVTVVATDPTAAEAASGVTANPGSFTISRTNTDPTPLTVNLQVSGTATSGTDYQSTLGSSVTIPADASSVTVSVTPINDGTVEPVETVTATVLAGNGYAVGDPATATVTIADDDIYKVEISVSSTSLAENAASPVNLTVKRDIVDPNQPLLVNLTIAGTAQADVHYVALPTQVEIPAGRAFVVIPLQPINDAIYSASKTVIVSIGAGSQYIQGFSKSVTVKISDDDPVADGVLPKVKIASPKAKGRFNAPGPVQASGTASDNFSVARVLYTVNGGAPQVATGTSSWSADLTANLVIGQNTLVVQSEDVDHNLSEESTVVFTYVQHRILTVEITPGGSVPKGYITPASLEVGETYSIVAKPEKGFVFAGWSDGFTSPGRSLSFVMPDADTHLLATFVTDPFLASIKGLYTGPVRTPAFAFESCGLLQTMLNAKGSCSGKLFLAGAKLSFKGEFNGLGQFKTRILRKGKTALDLELTVALDGDDRIITGTLTDSVFSATVETERAGFSKTAPYALAATHLKGETYNFQLPPPSGAVVPKPLGSGHGSFKVDKSGNAKWTARLRDGTVAGGAVPLYKGLTWPFFASLYKGRGLVLGEFAIDKSPATFGAGGTLDWIKLPVPGDKRFPNGFLLEADTAAGSLYTPPAKGAAASAFGASAGVTGTITFSDGSLSNGAPFIRDITVGPDNKPAVANSVTPLISPVVKINAAKGTFSGSFVDPKFVVKATRLKFEGVIRQDTATGVGDFIGATSNGLGAQTGTVKIDLLPQP